jgi:hypothetical protein
MDEELPFHEIGIEKQIEILKAFCAYYEKNKSAASYRDIAPLVGLHPTKVSGCMKFWGSLGVLKKEGNKYLPESKTVEFARKAEWGDETGAWEILLDLLSDSWFVKHAVMVCRLKGKINQEELINSLGSASGETKKDKATVTSLRMLVRLLELMGVIIKLNEGLYQLNPKLAISRVERIEVPEGKDLIQILLGNELFAVDVNELREFVTKRGKHLDKTINKLG